MRLARTTRQQTQRPRMMTFHSAADVDTATVTTSAGVSLPAFVVACSMVDLRLEMDGNPQRGERVTVDLQLSDGGQCRVQGIVHWTEMRHALHEVGLFLLEPLPTGMVDGMRDARRRTERYRVRLPGKLTPGGGRPDCEAVMVNYSYEGLAIRSEICGEIDDVFSFRWISGDASQIVHGKILWQIEQNGGFLIGGEVGPGTGYQIAGLSRPQ